MAIGNYDERGRIAARARESEAGMSGTAIALGLLVGALLIGLVAYNYADRTPTGSTAISEPAVTAPQTQSKTPAPPANTTTTPPSTKSER